MDFEGLVKTLLISGFHWQMLRGNKITKIQQKKCTLHAKKHTVYTPHIVIGMNTNQGYPSYKLYLSI